MNETELTQALIDLLNAVGDAQDTDEEDCDESEVNLADALPEKVREASTFEENLVLTRNAGLVLRMKNGAEFQITVVQSKSAK